MKQKIYILTLTVLLFNACNSDDAINELGATSSDEYIENPYLLNEDEVLSVAESFFENNSVVKLRSLQESNSNYEVKELKNITTELTEQSSQGNRIFQKIPLYIVQYKDGRGNSNGYSVVIGDDRVSNKIIAYNTEGTCNILEGESADYWVDLINGYVYNEVNADVSEETISLKSESIPSYHYYELDWGTRWHQYGNPYSNFTPFRNGARASVGCTAAAMGEIMAFHQWPRIGAYEKYEMVNGKAVLKKVTPDYPSSNWYLINKDGWDFNYVVPSNQGARDQISNILAEIAYKLNTNFVSSTAAYARPSDVPAIFKQMGYYSGNTFNLILGKNSNADIFFESIRKEIVDLDRPVFMAAWKPASEGGGGHAFIINGVLTYGNATYDSKDVAFIHVINGAGGFGDSWYASDLFKNPSTTKEKNMYAFRYNSLIISGIYPNSSNKGSTALYKVNNGYPY